MGYVGRIESLKLGPRTFRQVISNYQDAPLSDSINVINKNGIIGSLLLKRFVVILDANNEMMYIQPLFRKPKKFSYDRSGLIVIATGPKLRNYIIGQVVPGSPADLADVQVNDEILKVNGRKVKFYTLTDLLAKFQKKVGKRVRLQIKRGDEIIEREFLLKDLI